MKSPTQLKATSIRVYSGTGLIEGYCLNPYFSDQEVFELLQKYLLYQELIPAATPRLYFGGENRESLHLKQSAEVLKFADYVSWYNQNEGLYFYARVIAVEQVQANTARLVLDWDFLFTYREQINILQFLTVRQPATFAEVGQTGGQIPLYKEQFEIPKIPYSLGREPLIEAGHEELGFLLFLTTDKTGQATGPDWTDWIVGGLPFIGSVYWYNANQINELWQDLLRYVNARGYTTTATTPLLDNVVKVVLCPLKLSELVRGAFGARPAYQQESQLQVQIAGSRYFKEFSPQFLSVTVVNPSSGTQCAADLRTGNIDKIGDDYCLTLPYRVSGFGGLSPTWRFDFPRFEASSVKKYIYDNTNKVSSVPYPTIPFALLKADALSGFGFLKEIASIGAQGASAVLTKNPAAVAGTVFSEVELLGKLDGMNYANQINIGDYTAWESVAMRNFTPSIICTMGTPESRLHLQEIFASQGEAKGGLATLPTDGFFQIAGFPQGGRSKLPIGIFEQILDRLKEGVRFVSDLDFKW